MTPARQPTLRDVAELAGVAASTASLVFSGKGPVAADTVARVRAAAAELGYAGPNPLASSLRQGRTGTVAVIVEGRLRDAFRDPFAISLMDGLAEELDAAGTAMLLIARSSTEQLLAQLSRSAFDAAVFALCGPADDPAVDALLARGIPVLGTGAPEDDRIAHLLVAERAASASAAQHLHDLGHRRAAHVTMPLAASAADRLLTPSDLATASYPDARDRALGFLDVFPDGAVVESARADVEAGERAGRLLLDVPAETRPTAVVAQSDLLAAGVLLAARSLGLDVPRDLSVTGFDGVALPWLDVALTTVEQDGYAKGRTLGAMVQELIAGGDVSTRTFPVALRPGGSSTAPRA